jgi:hypothetical protein
MRRCSSAQCKLRTSVKGGGWASQCYECSCHLNFSHAGGLQFTCRRPAWHRFDSLNDIDNARNCSMWCIPPHRKDLAQWNPLTLQDSHCVTSRRASQAVFPLAYRHFTRLNYATSIPYTFALRAGVRSERRTSDGAVGELERCWCALKRVKHTGAGSRPAVCCCE